MSEEAIPTHPVGPRVAKGDKKPHVGPDREAYENAHKQTVGDASDEWWAKTARETLHWFRDFQTVQHGTFEEGNITWFPEGQLNASYNCLDRWAFKHPEKTAIIYEADEPNQHEYISYAKLLDETCKIANVLKGLGVKKGDTVSVYLPMTWYAVAAFLACARIGAIHSVVFAGFSSESLRDRIVDCKSRVLITSDEGKRGGKSIATKAIVDVALDSQECKGIVEKVVMLKRTGNQVNFVEGRDLWWHEETAKVSAYCPPETMNSEDPLFILYTSGSTGKPKGVVHTTAGYLLCAALTVKNVFDVHPDDKFACMADIGWITGHTYIVYGPLANGVTTTVFESTPVYPTPSRYWETVQKHKLTQFYSAPTAIRLLRRLGHQHVENHDLSSLRILGSVGEPINPEAWNWYNEHVGRKECSIVDTFWQTETGSIVITPFPGAIPTKPGSATVPFFGQLPVLLDATSGKEVASVGGSAGNGYRGGEEEVEGVLVLKKSWPSIARTIWGDHKRYLDVYMKPYPGYYFTGDGAAIDKDGYIWIKGRVDDVINVSGHRMSTAEIESALIMHKGVAETAVIGVNDELTGQAVVGFVTMKPEFKYDPSNEEALVKELVIQVRKTIGPFAAPKKIYIVPDLPKTRSGKIMRRIMRKIVAGEGDQLGDLSTVAEPGVVDVIKKKVAEGK
ncbi:acetyl-coenzyme A synthetase 2 [Marasmius tenuissimus]|uniref:Acetyl-coenzyme A synthetase n=1 Tax=Marasmius tenuissimus TaxID=585030 RepID=A0ABR2ZVZ0_9AGAR